jgi:hypothetical protein
MLRQACRVDSLCDHSMPEETHPVRGELPRVRSREASEEAKFACTSTAGVELLRLHDKVTALR